MENLNKIESSKEKVSFFVTILKGSLIALSFSLIAILVFAFVLRMVAIPDSYIKHINQVIKIISIMIGVLCSLRKNRNMGFVSGLVIGALYTVLAFISFSILDGNFSFTVHLVNDLLFASIAGAISGVIAVNFKFKQQI